MNSLDILNEALEMATMLPEKRDEFYHLFMSSEIYVLIVNDSLPLGQTKTSQDTSVTFISMTDQDGRHLLPIFSSVETISKITKDPVSYMRINVVDFIKTTDYAPCILNPGSEYSKEFTTEELHHLMGLDPSHGMETVEVQSNSAIYLRQPDIEPKILLQILNQCFSRHKIVSEGYLVEVSYESNPADKHLLVAVYGTGQLQGVFNEAVQLIAEQFNNHCIVDFIDLSHSTDLQPYFHEQKPFYKRA